MEENMIVLTPSALLAFLTQIDELKNYNISIIEQDSGIEVQIGDSVYQLESPAASEISVNDEVVDMLDDLNEECYEEVSDEFGVEIADSENIEGGLIKELIKTLAIGGLVRLTKNAIQNA